MYWSLFLQFCNNICIFTLNETVTRKTDKKENKKNEKFVRCTKLDLGFAESEFQKKHPVVLEPNF